MLNRWKDQLQQKLKKNDGAEAASDTGSNQNNVQQMGQQPAANQAAQNQQVAFNLNNMEEFTHEELQEVIKKYDSGI